MMSQDIASHGLTQSSVESVERELDTAADVVAS
ncbi:putative sugar kinase [Venturia inaequalis]|nr:putative sugar kinase [Venturia inaequalis]